MKDQNDGCRALGETDRGGETQLDLFAFETHGEEQLGFDGLIDLALGQGEVQLQLDLVNQAA